VRELLRAKAVRVSKAAREDVWKKGHERRLGGQAGRFREHWMQITFEHEHYLSYCRTRGPLYEREKVCT
jgi:hypothetical protein